MARIFYILSAIATVMILLAGASTYWFSLPDITEAKRDNTSALARGVSLAISSQLEILQRSIDGFAQMPEVISALESKNEKTLKSTAKKLQPLVPNALSIRLLPPDVSETDESIIPHMGFADLEMIQKTLSSKQKPIIQGQGKQRHLAITSSVKREKQVLGVLLASLKFDFIKTIVKQAPVKGGVIEVKQSRTLLAAAGHLDEKPDADNKFTIPHSNWELYFWSTTETGNSYLTLIAAFILAAALLTALAFFIGYRKLTGYLRQDQSSLIRVAKDMLAGKTTGNYPIQLNEMKPIISTLAQYKRVIDKEEDGTIIPEDDLFDTFFDEGLDTGFLDRDQGIEIDDEPADLSSTETQTLTEEEITEEIDSAPAFGAFNSMDSIFKAYDIRGIVDQSLTPDVVHKIGQAIGSEAKTKGIKTIVIGRDGRNSSPSLSASLAEGIISTGRNVMDIGMIPTPVLYFVTQHTEGRSGVMVTGSHNPIQYNGLKIVINGETLATDKIQNLKHRIADNDLETGVQGSIEQNNMFTNEYIGIISEDIHIARPMKIVIDCGNGVAGELGPTLLKTIGCEVIELYCDIDGSFPNHHPDPSKPENLEDLIHAVKHNEADVGIAFDGDGDRLGIVDSSGKIIWPDRQMMLFAKDVLSAKPGSEIIFDVKCSRHLPEQIVKNGGRPLMWKSGHSLIKAKLKETGAALAGEMSGHICFNDRWFGFDDGLYSATRLIEILSTDSRPSSEVFAEMPDSISTPELTVDLEEGANVAFIEKMYSAADFPEGNILNIDGMRVDYDDGWGLVRASNTTPSLMFRFEADTKEALKRIQDQFKSTILKIEADLKLPF